MNIEREKAIASFNGLRVGLFAGLVFAVLAVGLDLGGDVVILLSNVLFVIAHVIMKRIERG